MDILLYNICRKTGNITRANSHKHREDFSSLSFLQFYEKLKLCSCTLKAHSAYPAHRVVHFLATPTTLNRMHFTEVPKSDR